MPKEANATFIVQAVNCHQAVIDALKESQSQFSDSLEALKVIHKIWEAIAKAEGGGEVKLGEVCIHKSLKRQCETCEIADERDLWKSRADKLVEALRSIHTSATLRDAHTESYEALSDFVAGKS
jgi:hypothetical protein